MNSSYIKLFKADNFGGSSGTRNLVTQVTSLATGFDLEVYRQRWMVRVLGTTPCGLCMLLHRTAIDIYQQETHT